MSKNKYKKAMKAFFDDKQIQLSIDNFIYIEMLLQIIYETEQKHQDGWVFLTQYYKSILGDELIREKGRQLYGLRKNCHHLANKLNWQRCLDEYLSLNSNLRMFSVNDGELIKQPLMYFSDREIHYSEMLEDMIEIKIVKPFFPENSKVKYYKIIRSNIKQSEKSIDKIEKFVVIPDKFKFLDNEKLPLYKEKLKLSVPNGFCSKEQYKKMGEAWEKRPPFKIINEFSQREEEINYKDQLHIIGEVGQGKSNYKIAEAYRLVKEHDAAVGIIESKVDDVIKTVKSLRELGINAVPVIGKANIEKHFNNYIRNSGKQAKSLGDFSRENFKELEYLSGVCTISAMAGDNEISPSEFPCNKLYDDNDEKKTCPVYAKCGYYQRFLELSKASVWVATPHSLVNMTVPKVIDPYERTFYEAFYDLLDIVIVDEADGVQRTLDGLFLTKESFYGASDSILERFDDLDKSISIHNLTNKESLAYTWQMNYRHITLLIPKITRMISNTESLQNYLRREIITSFNLFTDVKDSFKSDEYAENAAIVKKLEQYFEFTNTYDITNESIRHEFNELYNEFIWVQNIGLVEEVIKEKIIELFRSYNVTIPKGKDESLFYAKFELFIYLVQLDFYFKVLSRDYPILTDKIKHSYEKINVYEGTRKALRTFLTEPMTGVIFGYKLVPEGKSVRQQISIFRYSGVGRRLLDYYQEMKKEIGLEGPAVVLLSGTSFAPGSGHYDLRKSPEYIIKSFDNNIKIEQRLFCKYENGELIKVSGLTGEERAAAIRRLTKAILRDIRLELKCWRDKGENRKVLLIVNSYDNCKEVGKVLRSSGITYRVLSRDIEDEEDFPKELLENFPDETDGAEVLVAPLNVISRGYNILNEKGESYFGSVFFMVRPYMVPDDLESYFQILHSNLDDYIKKGKRNSRFLGDVMGEIRRYSYIELANIAQNRYWKTLKSDFRRNLAWFTLVPLKQTIGRLQRGGTDCRVFYCDGSFAPEVSKGEVLTVKNSMLMEWYEMLNEQKNNLFIEELYGKFLRGLEELIVNINNQQLEDEWYGN